MLVPAETAENDFSEGESGASDEELQEAFAAGLLKPGLNFQVEPKTFVNNVNGLKLKLQEIELKLDWVERLDVNCQPAPMAPEMFHEINEKENSNIVQLKTHMQPFSKKPGAGTSLALDDFKREMLFHRQAQAAVLEGVARLNSMGIPTQRPDDYFAEMAKSDAHMHKVRESLAARQAGVQRAERLTDLRRQRKLSKQTQVEKKVNQAKEKKKMLNEVQKFRKGVRKDLNFLDGKDSNEKNSKQSSVRRKQRDEQYGFGGKKRGLKRNTKESSAGAMRKKAPGMGNRKSGKPRGKSNQKQKRPGKSKRVQMKNRHN